MRRRSIGGWNWASGSGPVISKFINTLRELASFKELLRSQVEHVLIDRLSEFMNVDLQEAKDSRRRFDKAVHSYDQGFILTSEIDGTIQMKSYLTGNPEIRLALTEDLSIGTSDYRGSGVVILDDCNFHESIHLDSFDVDQTLSLVDLKVFVLGDDFKAKLL